MARIDRYEVGRKLLETDIEEFHLEPMRDIIVLGVDDDVELLMTSLRILLGSGCAAFLPLKARLVFNKVRFPL